GIEIQRALGVLLGFFEVSCSEGARGFVELVLGPDLIDERTAGTGADKQSQDCCGANPGPRESHSISSVLNERCRLSFPESRKAFLAEEIPANIGTVCTTADRQPASRQDWRRRL